MAEAAALGVTGLERTFSGAIATATTPELHALARLLAVKGVFVVPTLVVNEQLSRLLDPALRQDPLLQYVPLAWFGWWDTPFGGGQWTTEEGSARQRNVRSRKQELLKEFAKANGRVVAGSATPAPYVLPGARLQREFELLVEAGLTPMQASAPPRRWRQSSSARRPASGTGGGKTGRPGDPRGKSLYDISQIRQVEIVLRDGQIVWKK